jgi:hypothetical protein
VVSELPKSPVREIVGVAEELLDQRLVEAELLADLLDAFLGRGGSAKYAAGSPGSARVSRNVTITTPISDGIANISRLPIMVSMAGYAFTSAR